MKASTVFTPGKLPDVTFIGDHLVQRTRDLNDALDAGGTAISLSGPSKSGKTVFIEKSLGREKLIQITGAGVDSPETLWKRVLAFLDKDVEGKSSQTQSFQGGAGAKLTGGIPIIGSGEVSTTGAWTNTSQQESTPSIDYLQVIIEELRNTDLVIFIDDFHYIAKAAQEQISFQVKEAIRHGVLFVLASVPYHSDDAVRANPDLRGRTTNIDFNYWSESELKKIALTGFAAMNISMPEAYITALAQEAAGSPQLMQVLCLYTCFQLDIRERPSVKAEPVVTLELIESVCLRCASVTDYSSTVAAMKEGPKTRGTVRNGHLLKTGETFDVYPLILRAIASNPPELTIRYSNLQNRIAQICQGEPPPGSSVTGACAHMCLIANAAVGRNIVEWDGELEVINLLDPYLLFFLRWARPSK